MRILSLRIPIWFKKGESKVKKQGLEYKEVQERFKRGERRVKLGEKKVKDS